MRSLTESSELSLTPWVQKYKEQPLPGTSGNNRPDLTVIAPDDSYAIIADVSCSFEGSPTALEEAAQAKLLKYEPLRQSLLRFPQVTILPFIVGSLGSWYPPNDKVLSTLHIGSRYASLMRKLCVVRLQDPRPSGTRRCAHLTGELECPSHLTLLHPMPLRLKLLR
eukprot:Em0007g1030a